MANYLVTDTELTSVADAIREKGGTTADLEFPSEFISAIAAISGGNAPVDSGTFTVSGASSTATKVKSIEIALSESVPEIFLVHCKSDATPGAGVFTEFAGIVAYYSGSTGNQIGFGIGDTVSSSNSGGIYISRSDVSRSILTISISAKKNTTFTSVDGTYTYEVYKL